MRTHRTPIQHTGGVAGKASPGKRRRRAESLEPARPLPAGRTVRKEGGIWKASCECGWTSEFPSLAIARAKAADHQHPAKWNTKVAKQRRQTAAGTAGAKKAPVAKPPAKKASVEKMPAGKGTTHVISSSPARTRAAARTTP